MTAALPNPPRFGAIDIGTNSVLLLVVEARGGELFSIAERAVITRLGRGVDATGHLDPQAVDRTLDCLGSYAREIEQFGVRNPSVVGTSALRDAHGAEAFIVEAQRVLGVRPSIVSGGDEAILSFQGATSGLGLHGAITVFDVGGGSTEVIAGSFERGAPQVFRAESINVGAVRLHERIVGHDPIQASELIALRQEARRHLADSKPYRNATVIGVAGTVTTLLAMTLQLQNYDGSLIHGASLSRSEIEHWVDVLANKNLEQRRAIIGLQPQRADVILAGAAIVLEIIDWLGVDSIVVSDRGLRWGLVERAAAQADKPR